MRQKRRAKVLQGFAILILLLGFTSVAAGSDEFIEGYASAVLERELGMRSFSLDVTENTVRVVAGDLKNTNRDKVIAALLSIEGIKKVEIADGRGAVLASSARQTPAAEGFARTEAIKRDYELGFLPGGNLFDPLMADPRWPHFSVAYQKYVADPEVKHVGAVTFGENFALYREKGALDGLWEIGFQGGIFSIFDLSAPSSDLINTDFIGGLQASYRRKDFSAFFRIFHQSSHLGDEFLLRNRIDRINLSFEGLDLKLSYDLFNWLRLYAGSTYLFNREPSNLKPWGTQAGIELSSRWRIWADSTRLIAGLDLQNREEHRWSTEISVRSGLQFERPQSFWRKIQLLFEYYNGHSPNGQFFNRKIEYFGPGLHLHF